MLSVFQCRFQYPRNKTPWHLRVPLETDVLITHTPPRHYLDLDLGCDGLLKELWRVKPKLHVYGHIHSGHGRQSLFWDDAQLAYETFMTSKKSGIIGDLMPSSRWIAAMRVILYSLGNLISSIFGGTGTAGGVLINAAMVYQNTTKIGNPPEVIEL